MSYSAHRPGKYDSEGRIILESDPLADAYADAETMEILRPYEPAGSDPQPVGTAENVTQPILDEVKAEPLPAAPKQPRAKRPKREKAERVPKTFADRLRTMAILGGAEGEVLDRVPAETTRFVQMFFVLVGTALVSAISMIFALTSGVRAALWIAIPLAIVWGLIIFNLDRFLTSTMQSSRSIWKIIALAFPRVLMAVIIGLVVAEPVVLQAFQNDIQREVAAQNIVTAQQDQEILENGPEKTALDAATERLAALENQAATGIVTGTSSDSASQSAAQSQVTELTDQLAAQQIVIDQARALYQCELTGEGVGEVPGCTGVQGEGASSDAAEAQLAQAQQTYDGLAAQLRTANDELSATETAAKENLSSSEAQNRADAQSQLPAARTTYETALDAYNARADSVAAGNAGAIGLLSQITGLNRLAEKEPAVGWAHLLIAALFFLIELLPVLVKVLTSYGPPSLYETTAGIRKQVDLDRVKAEGFRDRALIATQAAEATQVAMEPLAPDDPPETRASRAEAARVEAAQPV